MIENDLYVLPDASLVVNYGLMLCGIDPSNIALILNLYA